jgi:hypothetical protein
LAYLVVLLAERGWGMEVRQEQKTDEDASQTGAKNTSSPASFCYRPDGLQDHGGGGLGLVRGLARSRIGPRARPLWGVSSLNAEMEERREEREEGGYKLTASLDTK